MSGRDHEKAAAMHDLLSGSPIDRRALLRAGGVLGLSALLAGCGVTIKVDGHRDDYVIFFPTRNPPIGDIARIARARARELLVAPLLRDVPVGLLPREVAGLGAPGQFDPQSNTTPPARALAVMPNVDVARLGPLIDEAVKRGVKIVAYPTPMRQQTAAILIDPVRAATMLATAAASWAAARKIGHASVLLLLPRADSVDLDPFAGGSPEIESALRDTLRSAVPGLSIEVVRGGDPGGGIDPAKIVKRITADQTRIVLAWDDELATRVAQRLRQRARTAAARRTFVGAVALPAATSRATLAELGRDGALQVVVGARVRDLALAMVDLPHAILRGGHPASITLTLFALTPTASTLAAYRSDYSTRYEPFDDQVPLFQPKLQQQAPKTGTTAALRRTLQRIDDA